VAIQTDTLAEIYIKQGHLDRALSVYQDILARDPQNAAAREKFESLKERMVEKEREESRQKVQARLEKWLTVVSSQDPEL
jgi:cytochrome c-type biogenesis protein CcmH/NrfG